MRTALVIVAVTLVAAVPPVAYAAGQPVFGPCPPSAGPGARCGTVTVPVDRGNPAAGTIPLCFELCSHSDGSKSAVSTTGTFDDGPGASNPLFGAFWASRFRPALVDHDLLTIDHHGTGRSGAIDCPGLQHLQGDRQSAAHQCAAQLGDKANLYGSATWAGDVDDVRAALHWTTDDIFYAKLPTAMVRIAATVCDRSPSCHAGVRDPASVLTKLVHRIQEAPVRGTGYDSDGVPHDLVVDEQALLGILYNNYFADPTFLQIGEIFAAANVLDHGDATPLLRLVAESPGATHFGPADGVQSVGSDYATFCTDTISRGTTTLQWRCGSGSTRPRCALPKDASAPFSVTTWAGLIASQPVLLVPAADACADWPRPSTPLRPFPKDQMFPPGVPELILSGGLDYLDSQEEAQLTKVIPQAAFVVV